MKLNSDSYKLILKRNILKRKNSFHLIYFHSFPSIHRALFIGLKKTGIPYTKTKKKKREAEAEAETLRT